MILTATEYPHIQLNENQVPIISGTTMKVMELIMAQIAYGWTPEEIHVNHRYLTMAQIYAALAYYWDHKPEMDAAISEDLQSVEKMRTNAGDSPFVTRLKAQGLLR